jgi:hypothetical protein
VAQHVEGLGPQVDVMIARAQAAAPQIERKAVEA